MKMDSKYFYEKACQQRQRINPQICRIGADNSNKWMMELESYYIQIITTMFYELVTKRSSDLLSELCTYSNIQTDVQNYIIRDFYYPLKPKFDLIPILDGINIAFTNRLEECKSVFDFYKKEIFTGARFSVASEYRRISAELEKLDKNIGQVLSASVKDKDSITGKSRSDNTGESMVPEIILRVHDPKQIEKLNRLAEDRRKKDSALSGQIQQLQMSLQDELKQIMSIREGIDYNITKEAIDQFILLFSLVSETLQYHPNEKDKESYHNLIESCEDFLENIKQSLAMLGVTIINDAGGVYDPERHKMALGQRPIRKGTISKVVKAGFAYKDKVLEKAEVELTETRDKM